jgi:hypothetical protein
MATWPARSLARSTCLSYDHTSPTHQSKLRRIQQEHPRWPDDTGPFQPVRGRTGWRTTVLILSSAILFGSVR